ncbi:MAG: YabP/YqfC family sporulation protein [Ruminiclostridium sp.]|nr:YabP/YqfC family sporulation protein [Ruminiclostridium sp.]
MNIYRISEKYENLKDSAVRHSLIQINDSGKMTVEDCKQVLLFDENTIRLKIAGSIVTINGLDLKMRNYSDRGVIITGSLHSIGFEDNGKE